MSIETQQLFSLQTIESIMDDPQGSWSRVFKEMIISMIATNKNELLWYANFLSRCEYEFHYNESFTSAIYFNGQNFVIAINPLILELIHKDQVIAILKHNAGHIINHHFIRGNYDTSIDKEIIESAKDIVINGSRELPYIKDLPSTGSHKNSPIGALFYETLSEKYNVQEYEVGREFEYYVELIRAQEELRLQFSQEDQSCSDSQGSESDDNSFGSSEEEDENEAEQNATSQNTQNEQEQSSDDRNQSDIQAQTLSEKTLVALQNAACSIDSHEFGAKLQEAVALDADLAQSFMDSTLKEMIHDATAFARGYTPSEADEALSKIEKRQSHKEWRKIFNKKMRNYLSNSLRYREPNRSRQHPIYPDDVDLYGYSPGKKPKIGVVLDVSGSVDERLLVALMSEVQAIEKKYSIKNVTLVQVDAEIKSIEKFGVRDKFVTRKGSGGTIMEPGFALLLKQSSREIPDIIICATDGDTEEHFEHVSIPKSVQVIWLVEKSGRLAFDVSRYPKQQMHVIAFSL